jgi:DNA polymerase-1
MLEGEVELRRALEQLPEGAVRGVAAVGFITTDGESNFTLSATCDGATVLDAPTPRTAAERVASILVAFAGKAYALGKGTDGTQRLLAVVTDPQFTNRLDFAGFALQLLYAVLLSAAAAAGNAFTADPRRFSDARYMAWLLRPDQPSSNFDDLLSIHSASLPGVQRTALPPHAVDGVVARLHAVTHTIRPLQRALAAQGLMAMYAAVEKPLTLVLAAMKFTGFPIDPHVVQRASQLAAAEMDRVRDEVQRLTAGCDVGGPFNVQSSDHCRKALYDHLGLQRHLDLNEGSSTTAGGKLSTSEETLRALAQHHPLPRLILEYRKVAKLQQTYFEGLFSRAVREDGAPDDAAPRIHATFLQDGTETGRLSCVDPNLQNLPRASTADPITGAVRSALVAGDAGRVLLAFDYEQIELRVLAHLCGDEALRTALCSTVDEERDIHRRIAARIYGKPFRDVTSDERSAAKRVVFGVTYGMGPKALAAQLDTTLDEARSVMTEFKRSFPGVDRFMAHAHEQCRRDGFVRTILNRVRSLPDIRESNAARRSLAERQAFNTIIQGSAADIVKKTMCDVHALLQRGDNAAVRGVQLICQVHDELIFCCPRATAQTAVGVIRQLMETCVDLAVPLVVKASMGPNLGQLVEVPATAPAVRPSQPDYTIIS